MTPMEGAARVMQSMDNLLSSANAAGREPQHFIIRQVDWLAIGECFRAGQLHNPDDVGANTYKGVPIHFGSVSDDQVAALVDRAGVLVDG